ncbi:MAG: RNA polymerase sigma factor, partial [Lachnospiraceae bacterium]|nr:RNA polymerase sigma factor [Lachnospiraceae bacterium]
AKLSEELREVVILHYFQELSMREIAGILQIGIPLVKYRIKRAKELLREFWERRNRFESIG